LGVPIELKVAAASLDFSLFLPIAQWTEEMKRPCRVRDTTGSFGKLWSLTLQHPVSFSDDRTLLNRSHLTVN
jgi:hypothetical protein